MKGAAAAAAAAEAGRAEQVTRGPGPLALPAPTRAGACAVCGSPRLAAHYIIQSITFRPHEPTSAMLRVCCREGQLVRTVPDGREKTLMR